MTDLSLNEFENTCRKACMGSGLAEGPAAILARAAVWLERRGHPGAVVLSNELARAPGDLGSLPGLIGLAAASGGSDLGTVAPLLCVGTAAVTVTPGEAMAFEWTDGRAEVTHQDAEVKGNAMVPAALVARRSGRVAQAAEGLSTRANPDAGAWADLTGRAKLMLVPASEQSRAAGAGAGDIDND